MLICPAFNAVTLPSAGRELTPYYICAELRYCPVPPEGSIGL